MEILNYARKLSGFAPVMSVHNKFTTYPEYLTFDDIGFGTFGRSIDQLIGGLDSDDVEIVAEAFEVLLLCKLYISLYA